MTNWFFPLMFAISLAPNLVLVGMRVGRRRTVATLAQLLERGTFRLVSSEGHPVSIEELSIVLERERYQPRAARVSMGVIVAAACIAMLVTYLVLSSQH